MVEARRIANRVRVNYNAAQIGVDCVVIPHAQHYVFNESASVTTCNGATQSFQPVIRLHHIFTPTVSVAVASRLYLLREIPPSTIFWLLSVEHGLDDIRCQKGKREDPSNVTLSEAKLGCQFTLICSLAGEDVEFPQTCCSLKAADDLMHFLWFIMSIGDQL
jgi:hypothetical protein